jgi:hypothetical protein
LDGASARWGEWKGDRMTRLPLTAVPVLTALIAFGVWRARPKPQPDPWEPTIIDWMVSFLERSHTFFGGDPDDLRPDRVGPSPGS